MSRTRCDTGGSERRSRVLFVINSLVGGGAERVMSTLLTHSAPWQEKYDISLALLDDDPAAYTIPDGVKVHQLDCRHDTWNSIRRLRRVRKEIRPDISLSFLTRSNVANVLATPSGGRCILSERINTSGHLRGSIRAHITRTVVRWTYPRADFIVAVSAGVAAELVRNFGVNSGKVRAIPNPVDVNAIRAASEMHSKPRINEPYILALGRLVKSKNYELLIRAFASSGVKSNLVIAGDGPEREALQKLTVDLHVADKVFFPGFLPEPYPVLRRAHAFALSSDVEGFPNALVEALALEVPVVATNCPDGPAEILGRQLVGKQKLVIAEAGILVPTGDVASYAKGLRLAFVPDVRAKIKSGAASRVSDFSPDLVASRYWDVIESVLAE